MSAYEKPAWNADSPCRGKRMPILHHMSAPDGVEPCLWRPCRTEVPPHRDNSNPHCPNEVHAPLAPHLSSTCPQRVLLRPLRMLVPDRHRCLVGVARPVGTPCAAHPGAHGGGTGSLLAKHAKRLVAGQLPGARRFRSPTGRGRLGTAGGREVTGPRPGLHPQSSIARFFAC